jgi:hypothetical protein
MKQLLPVSWRPPRPMVWGRPRASLADNRIVRGFESKYWGWWYLCIGLGFFLLALVYALRGAGSTDIALRIGVAAGFAILGWMQLRYGR